MRNKRTKNGLRMLYPSGTHSVGERPPDPNELRKELDENIDKLYTWFQNKSNILCITGAGISTESGIPDYRGHNGSYHKGHKPMVHDQFMKKHENRQRYWGRGMLGWRDFAKASPNDGHYALAQLETMGKIGVTFEDSKDFYRPNCEESELNFAFSAGYQRMNIITQNVDGLHVKAGSKRGQITELHGRNDRLRCMTCGCYSCRHSFHDDLDRLNEQWIKEQREFVELSKNSELRPDGDAFIRTEDYSSIKVPHCQDCTHDEIGFLKPDVVFFGDSVPKHRVDRCYAAVDAADGILCIGSSLAVYSAYRFVQRAAKQGTPIAILNVGETRAEANALDILKVEAPAGPTLQGLVRRFKEK